MATLHKLSLPALLLAALPLLLLWNGGTDPRASWLLAIAASALLLAERNREPTHGLSQTLTLLAGAFAAWTAVSFLQSSTQTWGFDEVLRDAALMMLFWVSARRAHTERSWMLRGILLATCLAAGAGLLFYVLQPGRRLTGTFFDVALGEEWPNTFASLLLLAWPITFAVLPRKAATIVVP